MARVFGRLGGWRVALVLLLVQGLTVAHAQPADALAAGRAAFEQGDYAAALRLFQAARAEGTDTAALAYNIGVCQYRVGDYTAAEASFATLAARFPSFRPLAEYNRGLALLALERRDEAVAAFTEARDEGDERLSALARAALAELGGAGAQAAKLVRWRGYFSAAAGHDDNVALVDELSLPASTSAASPLTELLGYAGLQFGTRVPVRVDFSGYVVRYADSAAFDQDSLRVDAVLSWTLGDSWRLEAGPHVGSSTLDGDGFEQTLGADLRATRSLGRQLAFDVQFLYDDITSPSTRFEFVEGSRERLRVGIERRVTGRRLRVVYELDSQDRADPNVSPDRDRLMLIWGSRLGGRWSTDGALAHRTSRYDASTVPRKERLNELALGVRRELGASWLLNLDYRWTDNNSNVSVYSYTSRRIAIGVSRTF
jgi:hypothetical protein